MKKPKHIDVMRKIQESPYWQGRRRLPPSRWAELMRAIADDVANDELDEEGKKRVMIAMGRAAAEMDANEAEIQAVRKELANQRGMPERRKVPKNQEPSD